VVFLSPSRHCVILGHGHFLTYVFQLFILWLNAISIVGFEVLTAVSTKMAVFWVVEPCSLVEVYERFRGPWCLHHQGDHRKDL
jgi:hypothetical protein